MIYEGQQAWEHYRHVEAERNQYLGYFFTIAIAAMGLFATLNAYGGQTQRALTITISAAICPMVASLGLIVYWSVEQFRHVLAFYNMKVVEIRDLLLRGISEELDSFVDRMNVRASLPIAVRGRLSGPQPASELILVVLTALFDLAARIHNFHPSLELSAVVRDLFGTDHFDPAPAGGLPGDYPRPGRSLFLKAKYRF